MYFLVYANGGKILSTSKWLLAILVLVFSGFVYRDQAERLKQFTRQSIKLPVPLAAFPMSVSSATGNNWVGRDVDIEETVLKVAGNDDFLSRFYINQATNQWANVYVAYSGRPRTMVGHRPEICYTGAGWVHDSVERTRFVSASGKNIACLLHHFHNQTSQSDQLVVLNYYVLNGRVICDEKGFSGVGWRTPNIAGDPARYVAQIQISSVLENSVFQAAVDLTDLVLELLPDSNQLTHGQ